MAVYVVVDWLATLTTTQIAPQSFVCPWQTPVANSSKYLIEQLTSNNSLTTAPWSAFSTSNYCC